METRNYILSNKHLPDIIYLELVMAQYGVKHRLPSVLTTNTKSPSFKYVSLTSLRIPPAYSKFLQGWTVGIAFHLSSNIR